MTRAFGVVRARRIALVVTMLAALALGVLTWLGAPVVSGQEVRADQSQESLDPALVARGQELFTANCATCHGPNGEGQGPGPSLTDVGAASADFMLRTGRMPAADPNAQAMRGPVAFPEGKVRALVAYVASLGNGPGIPTVDLAGADLGRGEQLFLQNCAPCHGAAGVGGTLGNTLVPTLSDAEPYQVAEAVIIGPGQMPQFAFNQQERNDIAAFVQHIKESSPGGSGIGDAGPVPEGYVAWGVGLLSVVLVIFLISRTHSKSVGEGHEG